MIIVRITFRTVVCSAAYSFLFADGPCLEKSPGAQIGSTGYSSAPGVTEIGSTWSGDIALGVSVGAYCCSRCFGNLCFVVVCYSSFCYIYCRFVKIVMLLQAE